MKIEINKNKFVPKLLADYFINRFRKKNSIFPIFPEHIDVEVTSVCNLKCIMCPRSKMKRKIEHMDFDLFRKISKELGANKKYLDRVSLHLYGEPLLHPKLFAMVADLKANGIPSVEFSTNCTMLNEQTAAQIINSGLDMIILAVDGAGPETYGKIRVQADYAKVVNNIKTFFRLRDKMNSVTPRVRIQIIVMTETQAEIGKFKQQWTPWLKKGDSFYIKKLSFNGFNGDLVCEKRGGLPYRVPCPLFPFKNLTLLADGRATVCCYDWDGEMILGDAAEKSLAEIWCSQTMQDFCAAHFNVDFSQVPLCNRCEWTIKYCEFDLKRSLKFLLHAKTGKSRD